MNFMVVPFGLINAPTTFMCLGNGIFSRYINKFVLLFLASFLINYKNEEENENNLRMV